MSAHHDRRIYIAGPMRGLPDHNFPAFNAAAARFRAAGWHVENPVEIGKVIGNGNPDIPGGEYLRADVCAIAACRSIALLPGWEASTGARCEVALGITIGHAFFDAESMVPIPTPQRVIICGGYERAPGPVDSLDALRAEVVAWQAATFASRTIRSVTAHLAKEGRELLLDPTDRLEHADVQMLLWGAQEEASRLQRAAGIDIEVAVREKLAINRLRTWGAPGPDGEVEHVAEGVAP